MTGIWIGGAFLASAALGWRMAVLVWCLTGAIWLARGRSGHLLLTLLVGVAAGIGAFRGVPPPTVESAPGWLDVASGVRGTVASSPTSTGSAQSFRLDVAEAEIEGEWRPASGPICISGSPFPPAGMGDRVTVVGEPRPALDQPATRQAALQYRGCGATLWASALAINQPGAGWHRWFADRRADLSGVLRRAAPGDTGALLSGLVTGDDHGLTWQRQTAFLQTGTTHITAMSGANVALVVSILVTVGVAGGVRHRLLWQVVVVSAVWLYVALVGGEPPVVRAALVASAAVVAISVGRRPDFVTLLVLAAMIMIIIQPAQLWSLSFQFSFAASLGIALVMAGVSIEGQISNVAAVLKAPVVTLIAAFPILWLEIGQLSLTTLPANILIVPLVSIAYPMAALAGLAGLIWEPLAIVIALPARLCASGVLAIVDTLGGSRQGIVTTGRSTPLEGLIVSTLAIALILVMSPDASRWFNRARLRLAHRAEHVASERPHVAETAD